MFGSRGPNGQNGRRDGGNQPPQLLVRRVRELAPPFRYRSEGSTYPLYAAVKGTIKAGDSATIPTGYVIFPPPNSIVQVHGLPDLVIEKRVIVEPMGFDHRYRTELSLLVKNAGDSAFCFDAGTRLAELAFIRTMRVWVEAVDAIPGGSIAGGPPGNGMAGQAPGGSTIQALAEGFAVIGKALEGHF